MGESTAVKVNAGQEKAPETPMFVQVLGDLNRGETLQVACADLRDLVASVRQMGKKGKMVLTLQVSPRNRNPDCMEVVITPTITVTLPELDPGETVFFARKDGQCSREPFAQASIQFDFKTESKPQA